MTTRKGRIVLVGAAALALFACVSPHNRADIRILTHDKGDLSPHKLQAAIDIGLLAISVLVTWTAKIAR
ncbi:MAG: hypothetical protein V4574_08790 [Pseudomonadota bacterium]